MRGAEGTSEMASEMMAGTQTPAESPSQAGEDGWFLWVSDAIGEASSRYLLM